MHIDAGVGGGAVRDSARMHGDQARALLTAFERAPTEYANRECYIAWPGTELHTYVVWVLNEANVDSQLHPLAVGAAL